MRLNELLKYLNELEEEMPGADVKINITHGSGCCSSYSIDEVMYSTKKADLETPLIELQIQSHCLDEVEYK